MPNCRHLNREPFISIDPGLSQDYRQEFHADHPAVRVWDRDEKVSLCHERMLRSVIRPLEPQAFARLRISSL